VGRLPATTEVRSIVIDPKEPKRVYAATGRGVYRSDDAGQTWQPSGHGLPEGAIGALALDPRQPQRLYAATPEGALYLSEDGASSWRLQAGAEHGAGR